jgi:DNA polymerase III subunit epsilon
MDPEAARSEIDEEDVHSTEGADTSGYATLASRARDFIAAKGGSVAEDSLVEFVFGASSSPSLWIPLLHAVMGHAQSVQKRGDGRWALIGSEPFLEAGLLRDFVGVDVETTGLRPTTNRIIEVGLVRYADGEAIDRFATLCNPERRLPSYISKLTGLTNADLEDAALFSGIAAEVEEFLGDSLIVGHNVGFDLGFLNAELKRAGRPLLINPHLDVMKLAMRLLPGVRKPSLDRVATAVGLAPRKLHRAINDAELAAESGLRLSALASQQGLRRIEDLQRLASRTEGRPKDDVGRGRALLDRSHLAAIPKSPGVYLMRDRFDRVLYVGKSKNLRDRVSSYYSQPLGYTRRMDGLLESIERIDVEPVGTELEALLLESQLIKRYQPRFNTAQRSFEQYPYIRVDLSSPWPRITMTAAIKDDGARYFGPFKSRKNARNAVYLLNDQFPLRTCPRSFKTAKSYGSPCLRLDLGKCLGPCVGKANRDDYMEYVRSTIRYLEGDDSALYERIWDQLESAAESLDFERARSLRRDLQVLQSLAGYQRAMSEAVQRPSIVWILPGRSAAEITLLLVVEGQIWGQYGVGRIEDGQDLVRRLEAAWARYRHYGLRPIDHLSIDECNILSRWISRWWGHPAIVQLPDTGPVGWEDIVEYALTLDPQVLSTPLEDEEQSADTLVDEQPPVRGLDRNAIARDLDVQRVEGAIHVLEHGGTEAVL